MAENATLMSKGRAARQALGDAARHQFERPAGAPMPLIYSVYMHHERELVQDEVWDTYLTVLKRHMAAPGLQRLGSRLAWAIQKKFRERVAARFPTVPSSREGNLLCQKIVCHSVRSSGL